MRSIIFAAILVSTVQNVVAMENSSTPMSNSTMPEGLVLYQDMVQIHERLLKLNQKETLHNDGMIINQFTMTWQLGSGSFQKSCCTELRTEEKINFIKHFLAYRKCNQTYLQQSFITNSFLNLYISQAVDPSGLVGAIDRIKKERSFAKKHLQELNMLSKSHN